jgi:competence protein ComEC
VGDLLGQSIQVRMRRPQHNPKVVQRGAILRVIGQLQPLPAALPGDSFISYLIDSGHNFRLRQARWLGTVTQPSRYAQLRQRLKLRASKILSNDLEHHPDIVGALRAMLLGEKHALPPYAHNLFLRSGTMHLFAISGLHIGIIALTINGALRLVRIPRFAAFVIGSAILLGYVDLIGLTPSAIRAWIMITCFHGARVLRAPPNSVAAISASAMIVLLIDPMQLFSAGFQMSYSIVFMLLLYGVPLADFCQERFRPWRDLPPGFAAELPAVFTGSSRVRYRGHRPHLVGLPDRSHCQGGYIRLVQPLRRHGESPARADRVVGDQRRFRQYHRRVFRDHSDRTAPESRDGNEPMDNV